jgi:lysophospholipid hydrolase
MKKAKSRRHGIQAILNTFDLENDEEDETFLSVDVPVELEDSDYEGDDPDAPVRPSSTSGVFLSKEKKNLFKIVREIPILSYFSEEAIEICMEYVEYVNLDGSHAKKMLWDMDQFDGSLYYIVEGRIHVNFHEFTARPMGRSENTPDSASGSSFQKQQAVEAVKVTHEAGTVVTSLLSMMEGMVRCNLKERGLAPGKFVGLPLRRTSAYSDGPASVIRIPPICFSRILDRFPDIVLRVVQTALNRTQRVTVQTLVRTCGLREELLVPVDKQVQALMSPKKSSAWRSVQDYLAKKSKELQVDPTTISCEDKQNLVKNASSALAHVLGVNEQSTIDVLEENSSIVVIDPCDADPKKRVLLEAGSSSDVCFFLLQGDVELGTHTPLEGFSPQKLRKDPRAWQFCRKAMIHPGSLIGESACFTTDVNLFEVRCIGLTESVRPEAKLVVLLQIPKEIVCHLMVKHPQALALSLVSIVSVLSPVVHFLTWTTEWMHVEAAEEIAQKGTPCESLFVVLNGRLRAQQTTRAHQRAVGDLGNVVPPEEFGRGKIIGEIEALAGTRWPFDVFAIRQSELAKVPITTIEAVVHNFATAGLFLARTVACHVESLYYSKRQRVQNPPNSSLSGSNGEGTRSDTCTVRSTVPTTQSLPNALPSYGLKLATIAVVPLTYSVDLKCFCSTFVKAMSTIAPSRLLTKAFVREQIGDKAWQNRKYPLHDLKMTRLFADMEENNRVVIYQADPKYTYWTRLCIRQADCILLVVESNRAPEISRVEQTLAWAYEAMDVRIELVVVGEVELASQDDHEDYDDASYYDDEDMSVSDQLNNWSESRKWIAGHHLVRAPFERYRIDFRRMSRRISGRSVGLVLGGGGARGLAHLGVIRALLEEGVTIDMVGGTSQGAFCGALFARYPEDYDKVVSASRQFASEMSSTMSKLFDLTLPLASMFTGRSFNRGIRKLLGKLRIQDLVLNFFCVSVDLKSQEAIIHTKGLLWKYVRASMTLAGYLPPIADNGSLLVDGGYLNAIPADVMKYKMGARAVIAVDVSPENEREYFDYGTHLSGWWLLYNSWNPFVKTVKVPSMGDISDMLVWVASERHRKAVKMVSDLHLTPPVSDVGTLEYERFDEVVEKSYEYAKPLVAEFVRKHPWLVAPQKMTKTTATGARKVVA